MVARFRSPISALALFAAVFASVPAVPGHAQDRSSIQHVGAPRKTPTGETCAARFHARLAEIAASDLPAYRKLDISIASADPLLPKGPVFAPVREPSAGEAVVRARNAAVDLARQQGRTSFARDANTRWIAERIREDLTDYLRQGPSPFLCAGTANYLKVLREQAAVGAPSPERLGEDRKTQAATVSASLSTAFRAMRPAPLPRFAPADRPVPGSIGDLRLALDSGPAERDGTGGAEPLRYAERSAVSQISESRSDPDLPPIDPRRERALHTSADLSRAVTALLGTAVREGYLPSAGPLRSDGPLAAKRPVLARLAALSTHLNGPDGRIDDPLVRQRVLHALADVEALDILTSAETDPADPLSGAMHAIFGRIEDAHRQACDCAPAR